MGESMLSARMNALRAETEKILRKNPKNLRSHGR